MMNKTNSKARGMPMKNRYTTKELTEIFFEALSLFNECLESDISESNTSVGIGGIIGFSFCGSEVACGGS